MNTSESKLINRELNFRKAHKRVKFSQTEVICFYFLFMFRKVLGPTCLPKRTKFSKVNLDNQLPNALPSNVKEVEQRAICPLWFVQGTSKVSQIPPPHSPTVGTLAPGRAATRQRAWTAQSLIRTAPCIRGGSGHAQCLGILL